MNTIPKTLIPGELEKVYRLTLDPITQFFIKLKVHPNTFTALGFVFNCIAALYVGLGAFRLAGIIILLGGICDTIDGSLARATGQESKFGALFDSSLDRYSEVLFFLGMAFYFVHHEWYRTSVAIFLGLGGSLMVSYVRARAEGLGLECKVGLLQRPERVILLAAGTLILPPYTLVGAIWIIAVMANVTAIHRIVHVWRIDQNAEVPSERE